MKIDSPQTFLSSFGDFSLLGYKKELTDDGDGGATPDLFDVSGEAHSAIFLKGMFVLIDSKLHNKALPNDTQAPATVFPPVPCEWCLYPLILCPFHPVPYYEDRPLLENRRLWPSQHFDPFEEDVKSNTCHGSGEASI